MMRIFAVVIVMLVGGCGDSPASLGITGPGAPPPPPQQVDDSTIANPGLPDSPGGYGPSIGPVPSGGRYFNYN